MKKYLLCLGLAALLLAGCGNLFEAEYHASAPFGYHVGGDGGDAVEISNYNMLKSALIDLISRHEEEAVFRFSSYNGSVADDLAACCLEIRSSNPLGAYAVESMSYDTSRIVSYYLADIRIQYQKTAEEIQNVRWASSQAELEAMVEETVRDYGENLVFRVYSPQVDEAYVAALPETVYLADPVAVSAEPEVEITSYPGEGANRIYDLRFHYGGYSARQLRSRSERLEQEVEALTSDIDRAAAPRTALDAAETLFALQRAEIPGNGSAYDALVFHAADSTGVALAYKALCAALDLDCLVVRGQVGDMGAEEHWWNILALEGAHYHVDVSRFGQGRAQAFLLDDAGLWGRYIWDTESYPECTGSLRYTDLVPEAAQVNAAEPAGGEDPAEAEAPPETDAPEETLPPEEPPLPEETLPPEETEPPEETLPPEPSAEPDIDP